MHLKHILAPLAFLCPIVAAMAQGHLAISELLFQPHSGEAEYVELYNAGDAPVDLADYHIVRWIGDSLGRHYPLPSTTVKAHGYIVITRNAASVAANYTVKYPLLLVECSLPPYPDKGGAVILCKADGSLVERLDYSPSMHSRLLRDKAGVSLERRSFSQPANEASNWFSASSTCGYGTPGYENSQSRETLAEESAFSLSSPTLSPDGDDYEDEVVLTYTVADEASVAARAEVYDLEGVRVRRLLNGAIIGSHGTVVWDGRDDNGKLLQPGHYLLLIQLYGMDGLHQTLRRSIAIIPTEGN